jgi:hypothetical protein
MYYSGYPSAADKESFCDSGGIHLRKIRVWIGAVGLLLSLLSAAPPLLPQELFYASSPYRTLLLWTLFVTPPLALVANMVAVVFGRPMALGVIGLIISVITCALWAKGLFLLFVLWQNGPICP